MPLILHKFDASPPVRAVLMTAEILKVNYESREVNILTRDNFKPEYLKKNPLHSIPLLEDGDFVLADSHAIITYLVSKYGAEKRATFYPNELNLRATIDQRMYFDTSILFPAIRGIVKAILTQGLTELTPQHIEDVNAAYEISEKYLQKSKFVACNHLTVADISCVSSISSLAVFVPIDDKYSNLKAWWNKLQDEDWYHKGNLPGLTQFAGFIKSKLK